MTRSIPPALAPLLEELELDQPVVVTTAELAERARRLGVTTPPRVAVQRLAGYGWLLPTGVQGVWEFAPASHAGPYPHGDPFLVLRAQLVATPRVSARVALASALWRLGIADRAPARHQVSLLTGASRPAALGRTYQVSRFDPVLDPVTVDALPVNSATSTLVHLAETPTALKGWGAILDLLPDLVGAVTADELAREGASRRAATKVRLAYLIDSIAPELVDALGARRGPTVWFGRRGPQRRYDSKWNVADTLLPRHPSEQ